MEELKKIVAANLTALRTAKGMTQLELGDMISYSDKAISKWERGESIPDAFVLLKLSRIFGCTVDYLLTGRVSESETAAVDTLVSHAVETAQAVQIISIHHSKGLEYPIVFLCGTGTKFNLTDLSADVLFHPALGVGGRVVDTKKAGSFA